MIFKTNHLSYFLLFSFLTIGVQSYAQEKESFFTIKGLVVDQKNAPIAVGNLLILNVEDSSLIKGTFILDGTFELEGLTDKRFLLKITALGYADYIQLIINKKQTNLLDLGTLPLLDNNNLETVTVEATVPTFKSSRGKIIVNVERSMLSTSGTALDVLKKSPRIIVNSKDQVTVFGEGAPILYLDGQLVTSQELKTIPSSEIKEVEIIKNPSARYEAGGRAVINIITKRQNLEGYNGQAQLHLTYNKYFNAFATISLNVKKEKWSFGGSYAYNYETDWDLTQYIRKFTANSSDTMRMFNNIETLENSPNNHYYKFKVGYRLDSLSLIGLQYRGAYNGSNTLTQNDNKITLNQADFNTIRAKTTGTNASFNNAVNLNYTRELDSLDSEIFIAAQYSNYLTNGKEAINQVQAMPIDTFSNSFSNNNTSQIHLVNGQIDLKKGFRKGFIFEAGAKNAFITNNSSVRFLEQAPSGEWLSDSTFSNGYRYNENILGLYSQVNWENKKWFAQIGLRAEWSTMNGFSKIDGSNVLNRNYWHAFPSATLSYNILENLATTVSYSTSIQRPQFDALNPFVNFIDQYSVGRGNPLLIPAYTHSLEWELSYLEALSLEFEWSRTFNYMDLYIEKDGNNFNAITKNYDKVDQINAGLSLPYENKWWTTYNYVGFTYTLLQFDRGSDFLAYNLPSFYLYFYNQFRIPKACQVEINFYYSSAGAEGLFSYKPIYGLSASIERKFLDDHLSVRLSIEDILYSYRETGDALVDVFDINYNSIQNTRYIKLALSYNFGKLKAQGIKERALNASEMGRIKN